MILHIYQLGRNDIRCDLTALYSSEVYAEFLFHIRNSTIVKYEFVNHKLLYPTFVDIARSVVSYSLVFLKRNLGKTIEFRLDDFEFK